MPGRSHRLVTLFVVLALAVAACGTGDAGEEDQVASLTDANADGTTTTLAPLEPEEALLEFTACMRDNGVDLPDIPIGADGAPALDPDLVGQLDIGSDDFQTAFSACIPIIAAAAAFQREIDPTQLAEQRDQLVGFSQCMRDQGIVEFPDPSFDGLLPYPIAAFADIGEQAFDAAVDICQEEIAFRDFTDD